MLYSYLMGHLGNGFISSDTPSYGGGHTVTLLKALSSGGVSKATTKEEPTMSQGLRQEEEDDDCSDPTPISVVCRTVCVGTLVRRDELPPQKVVEKVGNATGPNSKIVATSSSAVQLKPDDIPQEVVRPDDKAPLAWQELQQRFPQATAAECRRFYLANPKDSAAKLEGYLAWREKYNLDNVDQQSFAKENDDFSSSTSKDLNDWKEAVMKAKSSTEGNTEGSTIVDSGKDDDTTVDTAATRTFDYEEILRECQFDAIPQLAVGPVAEESNEPLRDLKGHRIFCHFPARIDLDATSDEAYAEMLLLYIDSKQDRNDEEKFTLLVDVRPGPKWRNPPAMNMLSFIRQAALKVQALSPGRLDRCIVYPVPRAAVLVWRLALRFLNTQTRDLVVLVQGCASSSTSPTPTRAMEEYLSKEALMVLEKTRQQALLE